MAVTVTCPSCSSSYPVGDDILGKKIRCKGCQAVFVAMAAKVEVGAGVGERSTPPRGTNGVAHHDDVKPRTRPTVEKSGGMSPAVLIGGGVALVAMIGVTVWALFLRDTGTSSNALANNSSSSNVPKIALTDKPADTPVDQPKREQAKIETTKTPEKPVFGAAKFVEPQRNLPFQIDPEISRRIQRSAVWVKAGNGTGSGWFAEPGIVVTNSHVVGMENPSAAAPEWVKVVVDSGIPGKERDFEAKILGLDRENDLAVLRVDGENLPDPVTVGRSSELVEGQKLYTIGFPLGAKAAKVFGDGENLVTSVKVRQTHVSGRLPTKLGSIKYIQIEGGASHGNSGSMMVDSGGNARLILVAGHNDATDALCFGIPSEYAIDLLQGRLLRVAPLQPYMDGGVVKQELIAMVADPMKRIKSVGLDIWTGTPGRRIRPASAIEPKSESTDGPRQTMQLAYDPSQKLEIGAAAEAKGTWNMSELPTGHVFWVQPRYTGNDGQVRWGEAGVINMANLPVQRKPAVLAQKHQAGTERKVKMESHNAIGIGGTSYGIKDTGLVLDLIEKTGAVTPDGSAKVEVKYVDIRFTNEDMDYYIRNLAKGIMEAAKGMTADMVVTKRGQMKNTKTGMKNVPVVIRPFVERFNLQTIQSLEALSLMLPDREVQAGETWNSDQNFTVTLSPRLSENALFHMNYRYMGTRVRDGREEAVIEFTGKIARGEGVEPPPLPPSVDPQAQKGKDKQTILKVRELHGMARGSALLDLATGQVTLARIYAEMEFDIPFALGDVKIGAKQRFDLRRETSGPTSEKWDPNFLLPNQELVLNPFVGTPDTTVSQSTRD